MKTFKSKKHKRKINYLVIFTTDEVDSKMRQMRISPFGFKLLILVLCVMIGSLAGFFTYGGSLYQLYRFEVNRQKETIVTLENEKAALLSEKEALNEKVAILSETVNQKVKAEQEEEELQTAMALPTEFPLTGSAQVEETTLGEVRRAALEEAGITIRDFDTEETEADPADAQPLSLFTATEGTNAVASGTGTVITLEDDADFGYKVVIDHGNGYQSVYLNKAEPIVKVGDSISRGASIYVIKSENVILGYQIIENGTYINAMDMIAISG